MDGSLPGVRRHRARREGRRPRPDREEDSRARPRGNFQLSNPSDHDVKVKIDVTLIGKDGESAGRADKSDTVKAGNTDDNIRIMMHPRILDIADGKDAEIKVTVEPQKD
jgi:hypothetical protein